MLGLPNNKNNNNMPYSEHNEQIYSVHFCFLANNIPQYEVISQKCSHSYTHHVNIVYCTSSAICWTVIADNVNVKFACQPNYYIASSSKWYYNEKRKQCENSIRKPILFLLMYVYLLLIVWVYLQHLARLPSSLPFRRTSIFNSWKFRSKIQLERTTRIMNIRISSACILCAATVLNCIIIILNFHSLTRSVRLLEWVYFIKKKKTIPYLLLYFAMCAAFRDFSTKCAAKLHKRSIWYCRCRGTMENV